RGNIETRLAKVPAGGAVVVAAAALERLRLIDRAAEGLPVDTMGPHGGQSAPPPEGPAGHPGNPAPPRATEAGNGRGPGRPAGAHAHLDHDAQLVMHTFLAGPGGVWTVRRHGELGDEDWAGALAREGAKAVGLP